MSRTVIPAGALLRARRLRDVARAGAAQHAAPLASMCAFSLLGAPVIGIAVSGLIALSRAQTALRQALRRLRCFEEEFAQLRSVADTQQVHVENLQLDAQRRSATATLERARIAERARRVVCDPAQAIVEMLNEADSQVAPLVGTPLARVIRSALATFAQTVRDGFDLSLTDTHAVVLDETSVNLRDVIDGAVALLAPRAIAKGLQLRVCIDRSVAASVLADRERVGQIVFNLLASAIASADTGRLTLAARSETLNAGAQRVFIGVSDAARPGTLHDASPSADGALPADKDAPEDQDLVPCRVLAQRMGGDIEVGNSAAFGVCVAFHAPFTVERLACLPLGWGRCSAVVELAARDEHVALCDLLDKLGVGVVSAGMPAPAPVDLWFADEHAPLPDPSCAERIVSVTRTFIPGGLREVSGHFVLSVNPLSWSAVQRVCALRRVNHGTRERRPCMPVAQTPGPAETRRTVLVVDDNEINRRVVARQLDVLGYRCLTATGVEQALAAMARQRCDLLITDLHMPGASGVELAKWVQAMNRRSSSALPVVLVTGETDAGDSAEVPHALFAAVLPKPIGLDALDACLRQIFAEPSSNATHTGTGQGERLDCGHLAALYEHGVDVREVLSGWQQAIEDDLTRLQACRERGDSDGLRALLHRMSGAVGLVGAVGLMDALREASIVQPDPSADGLDSLVDRTRALIAQLQRGEMAAPRRGFAATKP
jgi:CheY-like chemotaxis protein